MVIMLMQTGVLCNNHQLERKEQSGPSGCLRMNVSLFLCKIGCWMFGAMFFQSVAGVEILVNDVANVLVYKCISS